jgi:predicted aminopeptidase
LFAQQEGAWPAFYDAAAKIARLDAEARRQALSRLADLDGAQ